MNTGKIFFSIMVMTALLLTPLIVKAQTSGNKASAKGAALKRLYFDHRGQVANVETDTLVINDRTYKVLSNVAILSLDQKPIVGLSHLKAGDFIGFTVDDERRIDAIYLLKKPQKTRRNKK